MGKQGQRVPVNKGEAVLIARQTEDTQVEQKRSCSLPPSWFIFIREPTAAYGARISSTQICLK